MNTSLGSSYVPHFARRGATSERIAAIVDRCNDVTDAKHLCTFQGCPWLKDFPLEVANWTTFGLAMDPKRSAVWDANLRFHARAS
jgi:hypothetical protein